ncbi:TIGR01906 family membrane protein [Arthrobacter sp. Y-9]|uniref:TIGR01906 family membrane protein n=1 Tax=Arthrobacter sp. Y-9 TaxID=3039385 RepID=UPI00241F4EBD|nr:TIGR01906 family membrane protein [Arthrobacter sp. Y-9]WFR84874.1 TIGR01906 family membrane protein [Arthrobacter sp. Y-9]
MSDKKPNDPAWDSPHDSDEPAFEWMKGSTAADAAGADAHQEAEKPARGDQPEGAEEAKAPSVDALKEPAAWDPEATKARADAASDARDDSEPSSGPDETPAAADRPSMPAAPETDRPFIAGGAVLPEAFGTAGREPGSAEAVPAEPLPAEPVTPEAEKPEAEATARAEEEAEENAPADTPATVIQERLPTSALTVRAPDEEVQKRQAARDAALAAKPVGPRVVKILSAIFLPLLLVIAAVRVVATPLFLWIEYFRPGFPGDGYGFSQEDRLTYGSYAVDYLSNFAGPRYLGDLVTASGTKLFRDPEISHMADVKMVTMSTWGVGALLAVLALVAIWYLGRRRDGSLRHAFFAASVVTLVIIVALGVVGFLGWDSFFTGFHEIFFANGTWTFTLQDTLIRLFPGQFWIDSAVTIAGLVFLTALVTLICTWPTKRRREARKAVIAGRLAAQQAAVAGE